MSIAKKSRNLLAAGLTLAVLAGASTAAGAATLINNATLGLYNNGLGQVLDGSGPAFPCANVACGDPSLDFGSGSPPNLSAASAALGNWLGNTSTPGGSWSGGPVAIPNTWAINSETAIIYTLTGALTNVIASFGVDNGIFVWLDGVFLGGHMRPGGSTPSEHVFNIGNLGPGTHYLQVLREDHGGATGYDVSVTGDVAAVPVPAALPLLASGLGAMGFAGWRRKRRAA